MMKNRRIELSSFQLRCIAMISMFFDHFAKVVMPNFGTGLFLVMGRLAYPIFAYLLVEGYFHTRNRKRYAQRLLGYAIFSEIPFNLLVSSKDCFYPFAQNVLWTLLIGMGVLYGLEQICETDTLYTIVLNCMAVMCGYMVAMYLRCDYGGPGILMIVLFYYARKTKFPYVIEFVGMILINGYLLQGPYEMLQIGEIEIMYSLQSLAIAALLPIWLYNGKLGYHSRGFQRLCYGFYPVHMIVLFMIVYIQKMLI